MQVMPAAAAVTLTGLSSTVEASRARIDGGLRTFNTYEVEIQKKFAIAVACAIFVLLGAPIAGEPLAQAGKVSPFWAMWSSNVIFLAVGLVLLSRVGRTGSTARGGDLGELKDAITAWLARMRHPLRAPAIPPERPA